MAIIAVLVLGGCASRTIPTTLEPDLATAAVRSTAPERPLHVVFDWRMRDGEARFSGSGAARIQPPLRARLDLFGERGDGYLSAALLGSEIRLPPGVDPPPLPPPALMWAVLGVVAPPPGAELIATHREGPRVVLYYDLDGDTLRYVLEHERLRRVELDRRRGRLVVELRGVAEHELPQEAVYRDLAGYTELLLNVERANEADPFPPETWVPGH